MDKQLSNAEVTEAVGRGMAVFMERLLDLQPKPPKPEEPPLLTAKEVAKRVRLSEKTVYRDAKSGKLAGTRLVLVHDELKYYSSSRKFGSFDRSEASTNIWRVNVSTSLVERLSPLMFVIHRSQLRTELVSLLSNLVTTPIADSASGVIRPEVAVSAIRFLTLLPDECPLPKVAPDHEGGLLLVWEGTEPEVIVTREEGTLHFVVHPGTKEAEYFEDLKFLGSIPKKLLSTLPVSTLT